MEREEFLNKLYNFITKLSSNPKEDPYRIIGEEFGYFDLPQKRSLEDLLEYGVFYRGFRDKLYLEELLFDDDKKNIFLGMGAFGKGIYSTKNRDVARSYSCFGRQYDESNILKMYIKDYKMANYGNLVILCHKLYDIIKFPDPELLIEKNNLDERTKIFVEFAESLGEKEQSKIRSLLWLCNTSVLAIILGYDIIDLTESRGTPDFLILNRSKVHVLDSDYSRILGQSKKYRKVDPEKMPAIATNQRGE